MMTHSCPALFIGAPASGEGKTTFTAALARYHRNQGRRVTVFKTGPDYLDPLILEHASGRPAIQLDIWMAGEEACRQLLFEAAENSDLILVEGVMGLFDGKPSGADHAALFNIPVAVLIKAGKMAQTFGAVAYGLCHYKSDINIYGVIANGVASERHKDLITGSMPDNINLLGCVPKQTEVALPERHLGLINPAEIDDIDHRLDALANSLAGTELVTLPPSVDFTPGNIATVPTLLQDKTIAIAKDDAFSFIYEANIQTLEAMGATIAYFSPIIDSAPPNADAIWFPGGYPELYLPQLAANTSMIHGLQQMIDDNIPMLAECGGMLYLQQTFTNIAGEQITMAGLFPGNGYMKKTGGCHGMQTAPLPEGDIKGHAHHRTASDCELTPIAYGRRITHPSPGEPIYRYKNLTASYLHLYFSSNIAAIAVLFTTPRDTHPC
ncbi:cobyrinic acid a,c-diamide synthase [Gammaproteobacteria bacterium 45_16_T64]|nr:cobyrinic acid a,c-diamide synthase [Gammaproteobacteria bacterium 45_16_T64]